MTQEWDDILSEPMTRLQPDLPAAAGGWRAVRSIEEVSPRPQHPPLTLPDPAGMLQMRLPVQPEEAAPASAPPPASLTDQLSLTWASRRRGRSAAEETEGETWPAWQPSEPLDTEPPLPAAPRLSWLRPVQSLLRMLRLQTADEAPLQPTGYQSTRESVIQEAVRAPARALEPVADDEPRGIPARSLEGDTPQLTLARRVAAETTVESPELPAAPLVVSDDPHLAVVAVEHGDGTAPAPQPRESVLRRWIARQRPKVAAAEEEHPTEISHREEPASFQAAPMVDRHEHLGIAQNDGVSVEVPVSEESEAHAPEDYGLPLPTVLRERMEKLLDVPLKDVRVFRNSAAQAATHDHAADALAVGTEVHIATARGDPSTPSGQALLAHELSHVAARILGKDEPAHMEERRAQAVEHAIMSQPGLLAAALPVMAVPALEHRSQPRRESAPVAPAPLPPYSSGGFVGGGATSATVSAPASVQRAPVGRIPAIADSLLSAGAGSGMARPDTGSVNGAESDDSQREESGGLDRIVDAVMRRLRREGSFERERRGSFRSEIGG